MGKAPSPPPPTPPEKTAAAQTQTNVNTAIANQQASLIDQTTPYGTINYTQRGTYSFDDKTDKDNIVTHNIPLMLATTNYTPEGQQIVDQNLKTDLNLATFGANQSDRLNQLLSEPVDLSNEATEARIADLQRKRMDPLFSERRAGLESDLANKGIKVGSDAYTRSVRDFEQNRNDAYNQMFLNGRSQALNEALTQRNQPLNELIGITSGTQVQQPQFQQTQPFNMANTDYAGITANYDQQRLAAWQAAQANKGGFPIGGLFSAVGGLASAFSDIRLKTDVEFLHMAGDLPIYAFRYVWGGPRRIGVMAQDMLEIRPEAVFETPSGFLAVDYGRI